jgi:hypothetical protein
MDDAKSDVFKWKLAIIDELYIKPTRHRLFDFGLASSDFFLFERPKGRLASWSISEISKLFEVTGKW